MQENINTALSLIKQKDEKGLSFLYDTYAHALMGVIVRIVNSEAKGEEILQETFLKVWQDIEYFDAAKTSFFTWMVRIARKLAQSKNASENKEFEPSLEQSLDINALANNYTDSIIDKLDDKYKSVLYCYYFKGFDTGKTSKLLNLPIKTIRLRLRNAISIIRENININEIRIPSGIAS